MGERGPIGKRSAERVRRNETAIPTKTIDVAKLIQQDVEIIEPDEDWHRVARMMYDSFVESAQCVYYEPTDWALAYTLCEQLSRLLKPQYVGQQFNSDGSSKSVMKRIPLKGTDMNSILKAMTMLLATESDRRRMNIEVERAIHNTDLGTGTDGDADVIDLFADRADALA